MKKEERKKQLKKLAKSSMGKALKEKFEEDIANLTNGANFNETNFEIDGRASVKAAQILRGTLRELNILKKDKKEKQDNQYV